MWTFFYGSPIPVIDLCPSFSLSLVTASLALCSMALVALAAGKEKLKFALGKWVAESRNKALVQDPHMGMNLGRTVNR